MDFFVSYTQADRKSAEWIAWQLEAAGHRATIEAWDFLPGSNFVLDMQKAAGQAERTIAVLSPDYLAAHFTQPEWAAAFAKDRLLPVRVRDCKLEGLLAQIIYVDLVGLDEDASKKVLLAGVQGGRAKPATVPSPISKASRFPGTLPEIWNVPHRRNPNFTGREQLLQELRAALTSERGPAIVPITGLTGFGKTQLAVEYAYLHMDDYEIVWWMRAEDAATLTADYASLAARLGLREKDVADQHASVEAVCDWLGHHIGWLLILDNAPNSEICNDYLPMGGTGHVLITSSNQNWLSVAKPLQLPVLPRAQAVEFIQRRCKRDEPMAATELCEALGDLPLALELAAAHVETTNGSIADYLDLFRCRLREEVNAVVAATWQISFERLQSEEPAALDLLYLAAFLAPDNIDPHLICPAFPDVLQFERARGGIEEILADRCE